MYFSFLPGPRRLPTDDNAGGAAIKPRHAGHAKSCESDPGYIVEEVRELDVPNSVDTPAPQDPLS